MAMKMIFPAKINIIFLTGCDPAKMRQAQEKEEAFSMDGNKNPAKK
jgi:hypothetical protein